MPTNAYEIAGMHCAEEVAALRREVEPLPGVHELGFDILARTMRVRYDERQITNDELLAAIRRAGMRGTIHHDANATRPDAHNPILTVPIISAATSGALIGAALIVQAVSASDAMPSAARALYILAAIAGGWFVLPKAGGALARLRPDMNLLMAVAISGAFFIGEYLEGAAVGFLFALSLALESWSVGRARRAIAALMQLAPDTVRVLDPSGHETEQDVADVPVGSTVLVKPGEKFPLDGQVLRGETAVNQAPITGESVPVAKSPGDEVFAGSINGDGAVEILTTRPATDTTLSRIVKLVGEAQSKRSPSEQWVERFARYYTPAVMALAIAVMLVPPLWLAAAWDDSIYRALVLLVIACPCALVISTPVSVVAALASAARQGVLVKGGPYLETPASLAAIAFDKTGTLTAGRPVVRAVIPLSGHDERELLQIASAIESRSQHLLGEAIVRAAAEAGVNPTAAADFQSIPGKGATARIDGRSFWVGSPRLLQERRQETPEVQAALDALAAEGNSIVVVGEDEHVCGYFAVADTLRPNAASAIAALRAAGVARIVLLTGDNRATGEAIGKAVDVEETQAELLPHDKVAAIDRLKSDYKTVAMVGDGVNDAPAMATASLGIAMGAASSDVALETADIALLSDDLTRLPWLIHHSRRTVRIIRQNIVASLVVKAAFVVLTFTGHAYLWAAIASDTGMSLAVIANALRLLRTSER